MKKSILIIASLSLTLGLYAQRRNMNGIPETRREPTEEQIAKAKLEMDLRMDAYIQSFLDTLEGDDFQKEIVKQHINSFYEEKLIVLKRPYERSFEREKAVKDLEESHFKELEVLISESDLNKIKELAKGNFKVEEEDDKKKKKRKKKKKTKD